MIVILFVFAIMTGVMQSQAFGAFAILLHGLYGLTLAARRANRHPLGAMFVVAYVALYFVNPLAIAVGWVPLERETPWSVFHISNVYLMCGFDLFVIACFTLRSHRLDLKTMPRIQLDAHRLKRVSQGLVLAVAFTMLLGTCALLASGVNPFGADVKMIRVAGPLMVSVYLPITYLVEALPIGAMLIALKRFFAQPVYWLLIIALMFMHFLLFQIRALPVATVMALAYGVYLRSRVISIAQSPLKKMKHFRVPVFRGVLAIIFGLFLIIGIKYMRFSVSLADVSWSPDRAKYILNQTFTVGDLSHAYFVRRAVKLFPDEYPYLHGQSYYRVLFIMVPRRIWPNKPPNTQRIFAQAVRGANAPQGLTIPPGIVGDLYINFGPMGVLGMALFGLVFRLERYQRMSHILILASSGIWLFHLARGSFTNPLVLFVVSWVLARWVGNLLRPRQVQCSAGRVGSDYSWLARASHQT